MDSAYRHSTGTTSPTVLTVPTDTESTDATSPTVLTVPTDTESNGASSATVLTVPTDTGTLQTVPVPQALLY